MSPLDDELRTLMSARAGQVAPSPDPLAGIESRARRMRRNRVAASVAGAAVVFAAIGLAVPAVLPDRDTGAVQFATPSPSPTSSTARPISSWPTRGAATPEALTFAREQYAAQRGSTPDQVDTRLLWGGSPDNGPQVLVLLGGPRGSDGSLTPEDVVLVYYAEDGVKRLVGSDPLDPGTREVNRAVDTGSGQYVVAIGEPGTQQIRYSSDGNKTWTTEALKDGVSTFPRTPVRSRPDNLEYTWADGDALATPVQDQYVGSGTPGASTDYRLDPADPWTYRGSQAALDNGNLESFTREWAVRERVAEKTVVFTPLYGEIYEPSQQPVVFYLARSGGGSWHWGVVSGSESGPSFQHDEVLREGRQALVAALPGDTVGRLLVVSSPKTGQATYSPDGRTPRAMTGLAPGIWITPLDGDPAKDRVVVLDGNGNLDYPLYDDLAPQVS